MKIIKIIKRRLVPFIKYFISIRNTHYLKKKHNNDMHVVFICQFEACWNKFKGLFLELIKRNIKVTLYIVYDDNSTLTYNKKKQCNRVTVFEKEYPEYCIKYETKKLKELKPSLVIYTRPYNHYLPKDIRSYKVIKYSKTGLINYYYPLSDDCSLLSGIINSISIFISSTLVEKKYFDKACEKNINKGYQKSIFLGFPQFDNIYKYVDENNNNFKIVNSIKVIWTPRWGDVFGGSNFLNYYKKMFEYFTNNNKYSFIFRPHPFMFSNYVKEGIISIDEKEKILNDISMSSNCYYDTNSNYFPNFKASDILITDFSSIIPEYFLTGNPIIYCEKNNSLNNFSDEIKSIINCNYVANSFDEILDLLNTIILNDYKKELRISKTQEFLQKHNGSICRIISEITK